ncbi:Inhibitor of growth protein 4 [Choanephora cucurbitarum]|uniref:Chromatin modification-related protein n=1 Tax=Choanephora cucurbitarum TaxID=101091 RepID=A0A1C7NQH1_9FUNG|nr:Inhibitor of growth protein 4 [Choanephora cucurbitarum]
MKKESHIAATYLDEYSDTVEALPLELQRNYALIRQLDEHAEALMQKVADDSKHLLRFNKTLTAEERRKQLEHIGQLLDEALKKGEEKFALAKSTYDTVDRHCTRLDNDLQKIEDEQLIGPARSSKRSHEEHELDEQDEQDRESIHKETQKQSRKKKKNEQESNYLSTQDAIQHAKAAVSLSDLPIDPNEPLYCYCSQVSFGEMVACDNEECEIEWFHLECVGLKVPPKGKWYCKNCTPELKKKKTI